MTIAKARETNLSSAAELIQVHSVTKVFVNPRGAVQQVLAHVHFAITAQQLVCLLGPTGCGKSTLLGLIAGFERPTSGEILFQGRPVKGPSPDRVVVFQDAGSALFGWQTALENVEYPLRLHRRASPEDRRRRGLELLELVHLSADAAKFPYQLSGGGKQRLQIARALAADPDVLLMDEPLGALDALTKSVLQKEIVGLVQQTRKTVVYVTHDIIECGLISDRVLLMSRGPGAVIAHDLPNPLPHPRSVGDPRVADFIRDLEHLVLTETPSERQGPLA